MQVTGNRQINPTVEISTHEFALRVYNVHCAAMKDDYRELYLEGKRENYQVCSVQYCVQQLCTVQCTHI